MALITSWLSSQPQRDRTNEPVAAILNLLDGAVERKYNCIDILQVTLGSFF